MAQINVSGLTFGYEGSYDNIFEDVSFSVDTDWKLGLIGRNGKGKTTFLNLLLGKFEYAGSITAPSVFDYFPFEIMEKDMAKNTIDVIDIICPGCELWRICIELDALKADAEILYRPYSSLSHGERTKVMLAVLFSRDNYFLLIDEPTNHLDMPTRELVRDYLNKKKGFILVSHDRWLLDGCVDHVLVLERNQIQVEKGNFSSWQENKKKRDAFELSENERLKGQVRKLEEASKRTAAWAARVERTKIGFDPIKEPDRCKDTRAYIGEKSKRMQQRRKNLERRQQSAIDEKSRLLKNLEQPDELKLMPLNHYKEVYVKAEDACFYYGDKEVLSQFNMELRRGDRIVLQGRNGCGKTSIIKSVLRAEGVEVLSPLPDEISDSQLQIRGRLKAAKGLRISWISQDTSFLKGSLDDYIEKSGASPSLFKAVLRQLDLERVQFEKPMEKFSEGQKKKVLIAGSLLQQAHLYIWDEPLNYIDVFSRMQIEELIMKYQPTMLIVEHDKFFGERCATQKIVL